MASMTQPGRPPEARLIAAALKRSGLSGRKAAERAGISEGRWRQIVNGYQTPSAKIQIPVIAPPDTLARMAQVVKVTPEQLEEAGRRDAAEVLRELGEYKEPTESDPTISEIAERISVLEQQVAKLLAQLRKEGPEQERDAS